MALITISPANPILTPGMRLTLTTPGYTPPKGTRVDWSGTGVTFTDNSPDGTNVTMQVSTTAAQASETIVAQDGTDRGTTTLYVVTHGTSADNTTLVYGTDGTLYLMGGAAPPEGILLTANASELPDIVTNAISGGAAITNETASYVACYVLNLARFSPIGATLRKA